MHREGREIWKEGCKYDQNSYRKIPKNLMNILKKYMQKSGLIFNYCFSVTTDDNEFSYFWSCTYNTQD